MSLLYCSLISLSFLLFSLYYFEHCFFTNLIFFKINYSIFFLSCIDLVLFYSLNIAGFSASLSTSQGFPGHLHKNDLKFQNDTGVTICELVFADSIYMSMPLLHFFWYKILTAHSKRCVSLERCVFDFIMLPLSHKQQQQQASNVVENYSNACVLCCAFAL